jgi:hypothetical protein
VFFSVSEYYFLFQFPEDIEYEIPTQTPQQRIPVQQAYPNGDLRQQARERDRRAQRAWWSINLAWLEVKKKILEKKRMDLERELLSEWKRACENSSELGVGYTNYQFRF